MAFPQIEGTPALSDGAGTSAVVTLPASVAADELVVVAIGSADGGNTQAGSWPGSWVEEYDSNGVFSNFENWLGIGVLVASGGETSVTVTLTDSRDWQAVAFRVSGHSYSTNGLSTSAGNEAFSSSVINPQSVSPGVSEDILYGVASVTNLTQAVSSFPTSYTEVDTSPATGGRAGAVTVCTRELNATSDDPANLTWDGTGGTADPGSVTFALRPGSEGAGGGGGATIGMAVRAHMMREAA